jgi:hypothetical protein
VASSSPVDGLPVDTYAEAVPFLRRPFTAEAVKFRVLQGKGQKARCAAYIDARLVSERLNLVIPGKWGHRFEQVQGGMMCHLTVDGLSRADVGWSKGTGADMDLKALYSDALKRAAVHFGIGVSLYAVPALYVDTSQGVKVTERGQFFLQAKGEQHLRGVYSQWLKGHGIKTYGEPLDHGDISDSLGDVEAAPQPVAEDAPQTAPEAPVEARAVEPDPVVLAELRALTADVVRAGAHPDPNKLRGWLEQVQHDGKQAEALRKYLRGLLPQEAAA